MRRNRRPSVGSFDYLERCFQAQLMSTLRSMYAHALEWTQDRCISGHLMSLRALYLAETAWHFFGLWLPWDVLQPFPETMIIKNSLPGTSRKANVPVRRHFYLNESSRLAHRRGAPRSNYLFEADRGDSLFRSGTEEKTMILCGMWHFVL